MKYLFNVSIIVMVLLLASGNSMAVQKTWMGGFGVSWTNPINWGGSLPTSSDTVIFVNNYSNDCTITAAETVAYIGIANYSAKLEISGGSLTVLGNYNQGGGNVVFSGTTPSMTVAGDFYQFGGTFNGGSPFISAGSIVTLNGSSAQNLTCGGGHFTTLVINNPAGVTMITSTSVDSALIITSGNLNNTDVLQNLTLGAAAILTESTGNEVLGSITTTRTTVNGINNSFGGIGAEINTSAGGSSTVIKRWTGTGYAGPGGGQSIKRSFTISPVTNTGLNATFVFHYFASELNGNSAGSMNLAASTDGGTDWTNMGGTDNGSVLTLTGLDSLNSFWSAGSPTGFLPIEISHFSAYSVSNNMVTLAWSTTTETNDIGFYIQRHNEDNTTYANVSNLIPGAGTSLSTHNYSFTDSTATVGTYYYRIAQVDLNGSKNFSSPIKLVISGTLGVRESTHPYTFALNQNYPNPFNPSTKIAFELPEQGIVTLKIFNVIGQEVATLLNNQSLSAGDHTVIFDANLLTSGVYYYCLSVKGIKDNYTSVHKMMFVK